MNQILYIRCHDNSKILLAFDTWAGRGTIEKRKENFSENDFSTGFFLVQEKEALAIIPSTKGPLLLIGKKYYSLVEEAIDCILGDEEEGCLNSFSVLLDGKEIYSTNYVRPYSDYEAYTEPMIVDFFFWVCDGFRDPLFIRYHTLEGNKNSKESTPSNLPEPMTEKSQEQEPIPVKEIMEGTPLPPFTYPWPIHLMLLLFFAIWFASFKPAWQYVPSAIALKKGELFLAKKEYNPAIEQFRKVLSLTPSSEKAKIALAVSYFSNGDDADDALGLETLSGISLNGTDWLRVEMALPDRYGEYFTEKK